MHRILVSVWLIAAVASALAQSAGGGTGQAAGECTPFRHPIDRRQAWRLLELGCGRRHSHGPREHESAWSGVRARLERQGGGRRPAIGDHDPWRDAAGRCGGDLHDQQRNGRWKSPVDAGSASYSTPAFYVSQGGPIDTTAWFLEALLARPDKSLDLLPGGTARAAKLVNLEVGTGAARQTVSLGPSPASAPRRCRSGPTRATSSSACRSESPGCRRRMPANSRRSRRRRRERWRRRRRGWPSPWSRCPRDRWHLPVSGSSTPTRRGS